MKFNKFKMKRITLLLIATILVLNVSAQQREIKTSSKRKVKEYVYPPNVIKLNLTGLIFKTIGMQYEHKISNNMSVALGLTYRPKSTFLLYNMMSQDAANFGLSQASAYMFSTAKYNRFAITPELKYYFKKKAPKGLYLAPFLRYQREATTFNFKYTESNTSTTQSKIGSATQSENKFGLGILFGYQIIKTNKLAIDFWFLGPWFGQNTSKLNAKINMTDVTDFDKSILDSDMEDIYGNQTIKWDGTGINSSYKKYSIGARMIGVNIGINF